MTLSHTLQSSPNQDQDQRPQSLFSLHLSSVSLSNLNLISLTLSLRHRPNSQLSSLKCFLLLPISLSLSLSLSLSQTNTQIKSLKFLHQILKSHTNALCLSLSNLCSPPVLYSLHQFHMKSQISSFQFSSVFSLHSLKALIFGLLTNEQATLSKSQFSVCLSLLQGPNPSFSLQVLHT